MTCEGHCAWAWAGDKERPVVVLRINRDGRAVIVYGTKTRRDDRPRVFVHPNTADGHILGLTAPTYFYQDVTTVAVDRLRVGRPCPLPLLLRLRRLVDPSVK